MNYTSSDKTLNSVGRGTTSAASSSYSIQDEEFAFRLATEKFTPSTSVRVSNSDASQLIDIYKLIYSMSMLPQTHPYYLDPEVANGSRDLLAFITENSNVPIPQILNRDGDALSLTWSMENGSSYLTVDEESIDFFSMLKDGSEISEELTNNGSLNKVRLLQYISDKLNATISR